MYYEVLSQYYDELTGNVEYSRRADFLVRLFSENQCKLLLDAGCGTGRLSNLMIQRGFDVIGVDYSVDMLQIAQQRNPSQLLLCQNLLDLDLYGTVQGIFCVQDTLNHLPDIESVDEAMRRMTLFLEPGGIFAFDINSLYKMQNVLGNHSYILEADGVLCAWQNHWNEFDQSVEMQIDLFEEQSDATYNRRSELIKEISIDPDWIKASLDSWQMELVRLLDGETYEKPEEQSERLLFITRKK